MKTKIRAKVRSVSTSLSQKELAVIVKTTASLARECSKAEDQRLMEYVGKIATTYTV